MDERTRRTSREAWSLVDLARDDLEARLDYPLSSDAAACLSGWLGRAMDAGRSMEREATLRAQAEAEELRATVESYRRQCAAHLDRIHALERQRGRPTTVREK